MRKSDPDELQAAAMAALAAEGAVVVAIFLALAITINGRSILSLISMWGL